nr:uncharacterized protein LOC108125319 [Drosophila bipectinata]
MKRHNAKITEKEKSPSPSTYSPPLGLFNTSSPETSATCSGPVLYVDVVKNMPKLEIPHPPPPPPPSPPEFSIFREDFPALPGTRLPSNSSSAVPDDWTAMLTDDEDENVDEEDEDDEDDDDDDGEDDDEEDESEGCEDDGDSFEEGIASDVSPMNATMEMNLVEESKTSEVSSNAVTKAQPPIVTNQDMELIHRYLETAARFDVSLIFSHQFLQEGVRQRAIHRVMAKSGLSPFPNNFIKPPPGFEGAKLYARMKTNRMGMPLGGVDFELVPPVFEKLWRSRMEPSRNAVEGAFGMLGLAKNLASMTRDPLLIPKILENEANLNLGCCAGGSGSLHASFSGPFLPGRCAPHELNFETPMNYRLAGRLGLQQPKTEEMEVELLFFFFYTYPGDMMQLLSAAELAQRGWRYHKFERFWIKRQPDNPNYTYQGFQESGEYNYFNMFQWKILPRYFKLDPEQLERTIAKEELYEIYGYHPQMGGY